MADNPGPEKLKDSLPASELSFDELYEHYATDVLRVAYYYLGDRQRAEDVMQDVFVKYLLNRPALQPGRDPDFEYLRFSAETGKYRLLSRARNFCYMLQKFLLAF